MPGRDSPRGSAASAESALRALEEQIAACAERARRVNRDLAAAKSGESGLPQSVLTDMLKEALGEKYGLESQRDRTLMWTIHVNAVGEPGWIRSTIAGGAPDPRARAKGVTMTLKCTTALDKKTPKDLMGQNSPVSVNFTLDNYGSRWVLLERAAEVEVEEEEAAAEAPVAT